MSTVTGGKELLSFLQSVDMDPSLGLFSMFPAEIRELIWKEFLPGNSGKSSPQKDQLAILRTSRRIYNEITAQIYPCKLKPFVISVSPEYKYESWISLSNGKKTPAVWELRCPSDVVLRGFPDMCPERRSFRIEIEAPDRDDGGQVICLFLKLRHVVFMLEKQIHAQKVEIQFKDGEKGKWFIDGEPSITDLDGEPNISDYEAILLQFLRLRNLKRAEVKFPKGFKPDDYACSIKRKFKKMMKKTTPFGEYENKRGRWSDTATLSKISKHDRRCRKAMEKLPGWTAMMLRLSHFLHFRHHLLDEYITHRLKKEMESVLQQGRQDRLTGNTEFIVWSRQDDATLWMINRFQTVPDRYWWNFIWRRIKEARIAARSS